MAFAPTWKVKPWVIEWKLHDNAEYAFLHSDPTWRHPNPREFATLDEAIQWGIDAQKGYEYEIQDYIPWRIRNVKTGEIIPCEALGL